MKNTRQSAGGGQFLDAREFERWSQQEKKVFWAPPYEIIDTESAVKVIVDLPGCGARDVQLALQPDVIILKKTIRWYAGTSWKEACGAMFGPCELFRRFDTPTSIDVNRVKAELEMGVLTVIAPKQAAKEQPAKGVPDRPHAFAA